MISNAIQEVNRLELASEGNTVISDVVQGINPLQLENERLLAEIAQLKSEIQNESEKITTFEKELEKRAGIITHLEARVAQPIVKVLDKSYMFNERAFLEAFDSMARNFRGMFSVYSAMGKVIGINEQEARGILGSDWNKTVK